MEVLRSNFESKLPEIEEAILEADYIAVDAEFTGLTAPSIHFQQADDLSVRYSKMKSCVQEFTIIQYGVCAFKRDEYTDAYVAKPFNFYIFGADTNEVQSRRMFSATPSSLTFLRSNKFDFNRLIDEGIPFYNLNEEGSMFQTIQGTNVISRRTMIPESALNKSGRSFLEYNRNSIKQWLQGNTEKPLVVQVNSNFYKKLIYQEIQDSKYNGFLQASQRDINHLEITRLKEEDRRKRSTNPLKLNFRRIIDMIRRAGCPVVAHNAAFDILHTVDQFWQYLPEDYEDFKTICNSMWPTIVDTKYLAEYHPILKTCFDTTVLGSLFNSTEAELREAGQEIVMAEGFDRYKDSENAHEAGYDAYMTGIIYLAFIKYIHEKQEEQKQKEKEELRQSRKRKRSLTESDSESRSSTFASPGLNQKIIFKDEDDDAISTAENKDTVEGQTVLEEGELDDSKEVEVDNTTDDSVKESDSESDSDTLSASDSDDSQVDERVKNKKNSIFMDKSIMPYYGRIYLMRNETPFINLKGPETVRESLLETDSHLDKKPKTLKSLDMIF